MKLSARLNAGHQPKSTKSVTWPSRTRSPRFQTLPPIRSPSPAGMAGWRAPERAKYTSIHTTAMAVSAITTPVAEVKKPKAMPEFSSRWIARGPTILEDSPSASRLVTTCLVTWSPMTAAATTAARPAHCQSPAPRERSATDTGTSAFVDEPTRTSTGSVCTFLCTLTISGRPCSGTSCKPLIFDTEGSGGTGQQAILRDRLPAALADPVGALVDPRERALDLHEGLLRPLLEACAQLAVEGEGRRVSTDAAVHADLVVHRPLAVLAHPRQRRDEARTLALEQCAKGGRLRRRHLPPLTTRSSIRATRLIEPPSSLRRMAPVYARSGFRLIRPSRNRPTPTPRSARGSAPEGFPGAAPAAPETAPAAGLRRSVKPARTRRCPRAASPACPPGWAAASASPPRRTPRPARLRPAPGRP